MKRFACKSNKVRIKTHSFYGTSKMILKLKLMTVIAIQKYFGIVRVTHTWQMATKFSLWTRVFVLLATILNRSTNKTKEP